MISTTPPTPEKLLQASMFIMERMVKRLSGRVESLLDAEKKALETVEEARRRARGIVNSIPAQVSAIEEEYREELEKYSKKNLADMEKELQKLREIRREELKKGQKTLDESSPVLAPRALELVRSAVEGGKD